VTGKTTLSKDKEYYLYISMLTSEDHYYKRTFKDKKERDREYNSLVAEWSLALK
jgi:uridine kinase